MLTPFRLQWLLPHFLYCAFRDLFKRDRWKFRKHHLGKYKDGVFVPYMLRWILQTPFGGVRLQKICASDKERHLHDHPFDFITIRLKGGGYLEETPIYTEKFNKGNWHLLGMPREVKYHAPFTVLFRRATDLHRLQLVDGPVQVFVASTRPPPEKPQWTLFIHGPNIREWGFQTEEGWKQWEIYEKEYFNLP